MDSGSRLNWVQVFIKLHILFKYYYIMFYKCLYKSWNKRNRTNNGQNVAYIVLFYYCKMYSLQFMYRQPFSRLSMPNAICDGAVYVGSSIIFIAANKGSIVFFLLISYSLTPSLSFQFISYK